MEAAQAGSSALPLKASTASGHATGRFSSGSQFLDLNAYLTELDRWRKAAERLQTHPDEAGALKGRLPRSWPVSTHGQRFSVPTDWLSQTLGSLESNPSLARDYSQEIQDRLSSMRTEAAAFEDEPATRSDAARHSLQRILRRREFSPVEEPGWWDRLRDRVVYWIEELVTRLMGSLGNHPRAYQRLTWTIAGGLVLSLMLWLFRILLRRRPAAVLDLRGPLRVPGGWREWARDAVTASGRGDHREAIHLAYWAGIHRLAELGIWQIDRTRTPREYLSLMPEVDSGEPAERASISVQLSRRATFAAITSRFERVWYGTQPASAGDFQAVLTQFERLGCALQSTRTTGNS